MERPEGAGLQHEVVAEKANISHHCRAALMYTTRPGVRGRLWRGRSAVQICWGAQHLADLSSNPSLMLGVGYAHSLSEPQLLCWL